MNHSAWWTVMAFFVSLMVIHYVNGAKCKYMPGCTCIYSDSTTLLCMDVDVGKTIPNNISSVVHSENISETVIFVKNSIEEIQDYAFANTNLGRIYVLDNNVSQIGLYAFSGVEDTLEALLVNSARLTSFPFKQIQNLTKLISIGFSNNQISYLPRSVFAGFPSLQSVQLKGNKIHTLGPMVFDGFGGSSLNFGNNSLVDIHEDAFQGYTGTNLSLYLDHNNLTAVSSQIFKHVTTFNSLKLSDNGIENLEDDAFSGVLRITDLDLSRNAIRTLNAQAFGGASFVQELESLEISQNSLETLEDDAFAGMSNLKELDLSSNSLRTLNAKAFQNAAFATTLETLKLNNNHLTEMPSDLLNMFSNLTELDLSNNSISNIKGSYHVPNMKKFHLNLSSNNLTTLSKNTFIRQNQQMDLESELKFHFQDNNLNFVDPLAFDFNVSQKIDTLSLGNNSLKGNIFDAIANMAQLEKLNLSHNHIESIPDCAFCGSRNITRLYLDHNAITNVSKSALEPLQESLKRLDLSSNKIKTLNKSVFENFTKLLDGLSVLDNPWNCSCDYDFYWLRRFMGFFVRPKCVSPPEKKSYSILTFPKHDCGDRTTTPRTVNSAQRQNGVTWITFDILCVVILLFYNYFM